MKKERFNCILESINPSKLIDKNKSDDIDNFFLALGLIYNDLKGLILFNNLLKKNYSEPHPGKIDSHSGEYVGTQVQINKLSVALISELMIVLKNNQKTFKSIRFKLIEKGLPKDIKQRWENILKISTNPDNDSSSYLSRIARIRSNIVYHYDHSSTQLRESFIKFFFETPKSEANKKAFYSLGSTMELSRLFYCDAAASEYLNSHLKFDTVNDFQKTIKIMETMNKVIVNLFKNYFLSKESLIN